MICKRKTAVTDAEGTTAQIAYDRAFADASMACEVALRAALAPAEGADPLALAEDAVAACEGLHALNLDAAKKLVGERQPAIP